MKYFKLNLQGEVHHYVVPEDLEYAIDLNTGDLLIKKVPELKWEEFDNEIQPATFI